MPRRSQPKEAQLRVSVSLLAAFMLLAPVAAQASPVGLDSLAGQSSSAITEVAVKCGPNAHYVKGHRDKNHRYVKGRCVKNRRH
jgi:hypothetical protein